ncbi:hypothetical protein MACJ_000469 [Theileria orientalis]|uniref:Uncharacterized protein n=1 Tax=Theileria orientalis TaxID=68886 RepID=A0A976M443_THEOR|nr:hypothetical protein MACJ_000469 [Theileria orientalis]
MNIRSIALCVSISLLGYTRSNPVDEHESFEIIESRDSSNAKLPDDTKYNLFTLDIKNKESGDEYKYEYKLSDNSHTFTSNLGFLIGKVTKGDTVLWEAKDYGYEYGSSVFVGLNEQGERVFRVNFAGTGPISTEDFGKPVDPYDVPRPRRPIKHSRLASKRENYDVPVSESESDERQEVDPEHLIALNLKKKTSSKFVTYERDEENDVEAFTAKEPYRFCFLMRGERKVWSYENGEFPNKAFLMRDDRGERFLRLQYVKPETAVVKKDKLDGVSPIKIQELGERTKTSVDINMKKSSYNFNYFCNGRVHHFHAGAEYLFDRVLISGTVLWKSKDESEYAHRVRVINYYFGMFEVDIHLFIGGLRKFIKNSAIPWQYLDMTKPVYTGLVMNSMWSTYGKIVESYDGYRVYRPKPGFYFDHVMEWKNSRVTTIWETEYHSSCSNKVVVTGLGLGKTLSVIIYTLNNKQIYFSKVGKSWVNTLTTGA